MGKDRDAENGDSVAVMPEGFGSSFSVKSIRRFFIRKVRAILLSQLALTTFIIGLIVFVPSIKNLHCDTKPNEMGIPECYNRHSTGTIIYIASYVVVLITYITIACRESVRGRSSGNFIVLLTRCKSASCCNTSNRRGALSLAEDDKLHKDGQKTKERSRPDESSENHSDHEPKQEYIEKQ